MPTQTSMHSVFDVIRTYRELGNGALPLNPFRAEVLDGPTGGIPYRVTSHGRVLTDLEQSAEEYGEIMNSPYWAAKYRRLALQRQLEELRAELARRMEKAAKKAAKS